MHHLCTSPEGLPCFHDIPVHVEVLARFPRRVELKQHAPPLVRAPPSIPLSFSLRPYSPGGVLNALASARTEMTPPTPSTHRLRRGLPGYLIPFAPHAFASQRQYRPRAAFATGVPPDIWHFTATPGIPLSSSDSSQTVSTDVSRLSLEFSHLTCLAAYTRFTPNKSGQRLPPTYYRGCWHVVTGFFEVPSPSGLLTRVASSLLKAVYNPKAFFPHAASLRQAFAHCARFPTVASCRSSSRVSVPVWLIVLSTTWIVALRAVTPPTSQSAAGSSSVGGRSYSLTSPRAREAIRY